MMVCRLGKFTRPLNLQRFRFVRKIPRRPPEMDAIRGLHTTFPPTPGIKSGKNDFVKSVPLRVSNSRQYSEGYLVLDADCFSSHNF